MICLYPYVFFIFATTTLAAATIPGLQQASSSRCRVVPGDQAWPQLKDWAGLNTTLHGRLIQAVPAASVCHDAPFNNYNANKCAELQRTWDQNKLSQ
jgi:hypothetical protein